MKAKARKTSLALLLVLTMLFLMLPGKASAESFSDTSGHWAKAAINRWTEFGVLGGDGSGKFQPDAPVTRAELSAVLNRIMGFGTTDERFFTDTAGKWYENDVNMMALQGIYLNFSGASLAEQPMTREEAAEMIFRSFAVKKIFESEFKFIDVEDITPEYRESAETLRSMAFIGGFPDGSFRPKELLSRAQIVTILNNIFQVYITEPGAYTVTADASNYCVAAPDVTIYGDIGYLIVLPSAQSGTTNIECTPAGMVWTYSGNLVDSNVEHITAKGSVFKNAVNYWLNARKIYKELDHTFAGGGGHELNPYLISTEEQLIHLNNYVGSGHKDTYFKLTQDITLTKPWIPIGIQHTLDGKVNFSDTSFFGTLDGDDYTVRGLSIVAQKDEHWLYGMFSVLQGAVRNLNVQGEVSVERTRNTGVVNTDWLYAGAIVGILYNGAEIDNCNVDVSLSAKGMGYVGAGGVAGRIETGSITNCTVNGEILTISSGAVEEEYSHAGGIAGIFKADSNLPTGIKRCISYADVTAIGGFYADSGGIVGSLHDYARVESCAAMGKVHAEGSVWQNNVGGVAAHLNDADNAVISSFSAAEVSATGDPWVFNAAGGVVGAIYSGATIDNCYSVGPVSSEGFSQIGGIAGRARDATIYGSYTTSVINAPQSYTSHDFAGLLGSSSTGVYLYATLSLNVAEPYFITYDETKDTHNIVPVGTHSLSDPMTYRWQSERWKFGGYWTFASDGSYEYPILKGIPEDIQLAALNG